MVATPLVPASSAAQFADSSDLLGVLVRNLDSELFLERHD
jgi:hypothetical protein